MDTIDILARTIYGEARGEGKTGMEAVACVVMNRAAKPGWWGKDIISICRKPWQFSCWNAKDPNFTLLASVSERDRIFMQCLTIAKQAVSGELTDPTHGATSYYDRRMSKPPAWAKALQPCAEIGHHLFFKERL